ncbi:hypothetical protein KBB27_03255 [Patescibacteria group bacterium]|nr:hypothetical protein [Patescibacteria group bacterium]
MRRSLIGFSVALLGLSLLGFGCKNRETRLTDIAPGGVALSAPDALQAPYIPKRKGAAIIPPEIVNLRQVLTNLAQADSYHSRIRTPASNGNKLAEIEYSKKNGLRATLQTGENSSEIYLTGPLVYVRYATSTWQNISATEEGQAARTQLSQSLLANSDGTSTIVLRDSAKVVSTKDDPSGCKSYTIEQTYFQPEQFKQTIEICVQNTFPVRIKNTTPDNMVEISFDRFNDPSILSTSPIK